MWPRLKQENTKTRLEARSHLNWPEWQRHLAAVFLRYGQKKQ